MSNDCLENIVLGTVYAFRKITRTPSIEVIHGWIICISTGAAMIHSGLDSTSINIQTSRFDYFLYNSIQSFNHNTYSCSPFFAFIPKTKALPHVLLEMSGFTQYNGDWISQSQITEMIKADAGLKS